MMMVRKYCTAHSHEPAAVFPPVWTFALLQYRHHEHEQTGSFVNFCLVAEVRPLAWPFVLTLSPNSEEQIGFSQWQEKWYLTLFDPEDWPRSLPQASGNSGSVAVLWLRHYWQEWRSIEGVMQWGCIGVDAANFSGDLLLHGRQNVSPGQARPGFKNALLQSNLEHCRLSVAELKIQTLSPRVSMSDWSWLCFLQ